MNYNDIYEIARKQYKEKIIELYGKGFKIAEKLGIEIPQKFQSKVIWNHILAKELIKKWKRKKSDTFCGQYTSDFFIKAGYDMSPILRGRSLWNINTTMQYTNAVKSVQAGKLTEITAEQAFYLARIARPALVLSPRTMVIDGKPYNHAALVWAVLTEKYNPEKGPRIAQQGWYSLVNEYISHRYAWGKNWTNPMVKYFLPDLK